jgi:phosphoribosylanthranilate isomerase
MNARGLKVKICGITNLRDALAAVGCGADAIGFNFYRMSPRYISPDIASEIIRELPEDLVKVGVFVNAGVSDIAEIGSICGLNVVQLHADEPASFIAELKARIRARVMKVIRVRNDFDIKGFAPPAADEFLLDSSTQEFGGSGVTFDWSIANEIGKLIPSFFLAGGLRPDNVAAAIRAVRPAGVDVSSGVESVPGKKDPEKIAEFIRNARTAL